MKILILCLSFFSISAHSQFRALRVAIVDTNFCPQKNKFINITDYSPKERKLPQGCQTHGQLILEELIKLQSYFDVDLYSVFDKDGIQKAEYWEQFLKEYNKRFYDHTLIAVGTEFPLSKKLIESFLKTAGDKLVAAGQVSKGIESGRSLFPQNLHKNKNIVLIGGYIKTLRGKKRLPELQFFNNHLEEKYEIKGNLKISGSSQAALNALLKRIKAFIRAGR